MLRSKRVTLCRKGIELNDSWTHTLPGTTLDLFLGDLVSIQLACLAEA
jgi:hypothetical protein